MSVAIARLVLLSFIVISAGAAFSATAELAQPKVQALLSEARQLHKENKFSQALIPARQALQIAEKEFGPMHLLTAEALSMAGDVEHAVENRAVAADLLGRALRIREASPDATPESIANTLETMANIAKWRNLLSEATGYAQRSLAIRETLPPDDSKVVNSLDALGEIAWEAGDLDGAQQYLDRAIGLLRLRPNDEMTAKIRNSLSAVMYFRGDYDGALAQLAEVMEIRRRTAGPESISVSYAHDNMGANLMGADRIAEAKEHFLTALALVEKIRGPGRSWTSYAFSNLGNLYLAVGDYKQSLSYFEENLARNRAVLGETHGRTGSAFYGLARAQLGLGDLPAAQASVLRALQIARETLGVAHRDVAAYQSLLATILVRMGDRAAAREQLVQAHAVNEQQLGADSAAATGTRLKLASLWLDENNTDQANTLLIDAMEASLALNSPVLRSAVLDEYRRLLSMLGRRDEAVFFGKQAVNNLQAVRMRNTALESELQLLFLKKQEASYRELINLLIDAGRLDEAQQILAMLKEYELFEFIRRDKPSDPRSTRATFTRDEAAWANRYQEISSNLAAMSLELDALSGQQDWTLTTEQRARLIALKSDMKVARTAFTSYLRESRASFVQMGGQRVVEFKTKELGGLSSLQASLRRLGKGTALVHYLVNNDRLRILLTTPEVQLHRETAITNSDLNALIFAHRQTLQNPASDSTVAALKLYDVLLKPIAEDLRQARVRTLMISPDDTLRYVSFAALFDGKQYLMQRYALAVYTPVARTNLEQRPAKTWTAAGLGVTRSIGEFSALPSVAQELDMVVRDKNANRLDRRGVFAGEKHIDEAFTAASLSAVIDRRYPVLHIASHFKFQAGNEEQSYLLLGDGTQLSARGLREGAYNMTGIDLVTLSACDTALGSRDANGREIEGLAGIAQNHGALAVMASLWSVADFSTARFMERFYRLRTDKGLSKAEALRRVQIEFLQAADVRGTRTQHPYYWAPFILMGNWL